jgi:transposase
LPHLTRIRLRAHRWMNGVWHVDLSSRRRFAMCPRCQHRSGAVHSTYRRTVADLPLAGATLVRHLQVRRFFCRHATCPQRFFAERFPTLVPVRGRHSLGVYSALRHVGMAVGGRAGVRLARALGLPGSFRTIVRLVHGAPFPLPKLPRVIGLDEWAWRRGRRFGTMICDLERHHVLDLLPERSASSVAQWLQAYPSVEIVCRDRSGLYAEGIRQGAPQAIQVIDRFHLVQNLRDALEWNAGCRNAQQLWRELVAQGHRPSRMTVERYVGQLRRETGTRRKFRQAAPAPVYAEDPDESRPAPLTALRAARLFLANPEGQRSSDQTLLARLLRFDPVMPGTYYHVQTFRRMIRERRGHAFDAWIAEVQQTGVKELRAFVKGLLKDEAAVHAGLSLVWSNGPTEGCIHRLKLIKRQAYGRAGVDFLRHRILAPSAGTAA